MRDTQRESPPLVPKLAGREGQHTTGSCSVLNQVVNVYSDHLCVMDKPVLVSLQRDRCV